MWSPTCRQACTDPSRRQPATQSLCTRTPTTPCMWRRNCHKWLAWESRTYPPTRTSSKQRSRWLKASWYNNKLQYTEKTVAKKRSRRRNVIWFNSPWYDEISTNVTKKFLKMIDRQEHCGGRWHHQTVHRTHLKHLQGEVHWKQGLLHPPQACPQDDPLKPHLGAEGWADHLQSIESILSLVPSYSRRVRICHICLMEKTHISLAVPRTTLNKRN